MDEEGIERKEYLLGKFSRVTYSSIRKFIWNVGFRIISVIGGETFFKNVVEIRIVGIGVLFLIYQGDGFYGT